MININLLPIEKKEKAKIVKQNLGFLIVCLAILIVVGIFIIILLAVQYTLKTSLEGARGSINSAKETLGEYQTIKNEILFIKDRMKELNQLKDKKTTWSNNLKSLIQVTPETVQLTDFVINTQETKPLKISGLTQERVEIVKLQAQLEVSPLFQDISIESSKKITVNEKEYIDFTLKGQLENPPQKD